MNFMTSATLANSDQKTSQSSTFVNNLSLSVHQWYRYSAGFSAEWVNQTILKMAKGRKINDFDPFAGSGTVLIESEKLGINSIGIESHPFVSRIAQSKLSWKENPRDFKEFAYSLLIKGKTQKSSGNQICKKYSNNSNNVKKNFSTSTFYDNS